MPKIILRTDIGPDVEVSDEQRLGRSETYCPKTGKHVGFVALYGTSKNLLVEINDKRRPLGKNREVRAFPREARPTDILRAVEDTLAAYSLKHVLIQAKLIDESVLVAADRIAADHG